MEITAYASGYFGEDIIFKGLQRGEISEYNPYVKYVDDSSLVLSGTDTWRDDPHDTNIVLRALCCALHEAGVTTVNDYQHDFDHVPVVEYMRYLKALYNDPEVETTSGTTHFMDKYKRRS